MAHARYVLLHKAEGDIARSGRNRLGTDRRGRLHWVTNQLDLFGPKPSAPSSVEPTLSVATASPAPTEPVVVLPTAPREEPTNPPTPVLPGKLNVDVDVDTGRMMVHPVAMATTDTEAEGTRPAETAERIEGNVYMIGGKWHIERRDLAVGARVAVHGYGRTVTGTVQYGGILGDPYLTDVQVQNDPLPPIVDGSITLPNLSGHAHARAWRAGDIVEVHDGHYKVGQPKLNSYGSAITYRLTPATAKQWATRPGRVTLNVATSDVPHQVGRAIKIGEEWLRIEEVKRRPYTSGEGEVFGYTYVGFGHFVSPTVADKANRQWDREQRVRDLDLQLRVAAHSDMASRDQIAGLERELAEARSAARAGKS